MKARVRIALSLLVLGAAGCENAVYWPPVANSPALAKQGDVGVALHGSPIQGQMNGGVAVTNHLAARFNAEYRIATDQDPTYGGDLGLGWFTTQDAAEKGPDGAIGWREGISLDLGKGQVNDLRKDLAAQFSQDGVLTSLDFHELRYKTDFTRATLQADAGYQFQTYSLVAVARYSATQGKLHFRGTQGGTDTLAEEDANWEFFDAIGIVRARLIEHLNLEVQLGASVPVGRVGPIATDGQLWPIVFAVGLQPGF